MSRSQILPTCNGCDLRDSALAEKDAIRFKMNSWNEELQRLCAEKDAEIVRIKEKLKIAVEALEDAIENMSLSELF